MGQEGTQTMRVMVASDTVADLTSLQAGTALAQGWPSADVLVTPVGEAGAGFLTALADSAGVGVDTGGWGDAVVSTAYTADWAAVQVEGVRSGEPIPYEATSRPLGEALAELLAAHRPARVYLDLAGLEVHDGGAGMLAGLGAGADAELGCGVRELAQLTELDLSAVRAAVTGVELVGLVPQDQLRQPLLGLRGITSLAGRTAGTTPTQMLATDGALENFARLAAADQSNTPGAGACGGLGFAVLALGGRLSTGPEVCLSGVAFAGADLVVTGCSVFDFAARGGGVVKAVAEAAAEALSPCIAIAGEVVIGAREMRTMGIDAAYATCDTHPGPVTAEALSATARRVARSWTW